MIYDKYNTRINCLINIKTFYVDFLLQWEYQRKNKGTFGHPGGILHAALPGIATYLCLIWPNGMLLLPTWLLYSLAVSDSVIHYFVDWAKMNINKYFGWKPDTSPMFWYLLGLDQLLHYATYVVIIKIIVDSFSILHKQYNI